MERPPHLTSTPASEASGRFLFPSRSPGLLTPWKRSTQTRQVLHTFNIRSVEHTAPGTLPSTFDILMFALKGPIAAEPIPYSGPSSVNVGIPPMPDVRPEGINCSRANALLGGRHPSTWGSHSCGRPALLDHKPNVLYKCYIV